MAGSRRLQSRIVLGRNIKLYRERNSHTQESLSVELGITSKHLSNIERGKRFVTADLLDKLAEIFNIPYADLFLEAEIDKSYRQKSQVKRISSIIDRELAEFKESLKQRVIDSL